LANCNEGTAQVEGKSILGIFGLGFLGGLFALIMPCIFPMIPLTVNFFNKSSKSKAVGIRRAGLYGFFILLIYLLLSLPFHLIEGVDAGILYDIASSVWLNLFFFVIFLFFAGSFFGYYELTLPASWSNRASRGENTGGIVGIFFMALTLALVSFSCTGPILGSLLVGAVSEGAWPLTAGMAGFGLALALPFTLFAAFPQWLQSLPSSGGWLNSVKVVLGFVEIALALKFLSNADLVGEWDWLKIEYFYIVWILCCVGIAAYLFKLIRFPHDSKNRKIGLTSIGVALASLAFGAYLITGFQKDPELGSYQPLGFISGFPPPVCYSAWNPCDCPQGIPCFKDLDEGLAYACEVGKPIMLDFTGYSCVNCRRMEENVWSQPRIRNILSNDYVLISLYVDDQSALPVDQQQKVPRIDRPESTFLINKVGKKWQYLQQSVYAKNSQPYYALISPNGQTLNPPVAYTPDVVDKSLARSGETLHT
ncbi:MAG: thioredoxin family protein, partial [Bacteroidota bacterium]